ncbi:hypothetical protein C8Q77DRAFT_1029982, partial [Trametes polyzona]
GKILAPTAYEPIAPGAAFNFSYHASADYCRSTYAYSVWLVTQAPGTESLAPADVWGGGWFFGRFDYPNYPAVPYPHNEAPPQLTMPNFEDPHEQGFGNSYTLVNKTLTLAVIEEWDGCDPNGPPGMKLSLTTVPVLYNATTSA